MQWLVIQQQSVVKVKLNIVHNIVNIVKSKVTAESGRKFREGVVL